MRGSYTGDLTHLSGVDTADGSLAVVTFTSRHHTRIVVSNRLIPCKRDAWIQRCVSAGPALTALWIRARALHSTAHRVGQIIAS